MEHHIIPKNSIENFKSEKGFFASKNNGDGRSDVVIRNPGTFTFKDLYALHGKDGWDQEIEKKFAKIENGLSINLKKIEKVLEEIRIEGGRVCSDYKFPPGLNDIIILYAQLLYKKVGIYKVLHHYNLAHGLHQGRENLDYRNDILKKAFDKIKLPIDKYCIISFIESKPGSEFLITDSPFYIHPSNKDIKNIKTDEHWEVNIPLSQRWIITISNQNTCTDILHEINYIPWLNTNDKKYIFARTIEPNNLLAHNAFWFIGGGNKKLVEYYVHLKKYNEIYQYKKKELYSETEILKTEYFLKVFDL